MRVPSTDGVNVAVHEFGGTGRPLLLSHATGFHGYCYLPIADTLDDRFTSYAIDYRGHGDTAWPTGWSVDWQGYGDDALAVSRAVAARAAGSGNTDGLVGFGHSMGGGALLMAAHADPSLFDLLVVFEPIVFPAVPFGEDPPKKSDLPEGARRRRATFESFEAAIENYSSKPPLMWFDPDVLRLYVAHGFRPSPEGVRLKCDPEHEAQTFESAINPATWDALPEIETRVVVVYGALDGQGPAMIAPRIAEQLPNAEAVHLADSNHFGPFIQPARFAALIADRI